MIYAFRYLDELVLSVKVTIAIHPVAVGLHEIGLLLVVFVIGARTRSLMEFVVLILLKRKLSVIIFAF